MDKLQENDVKPDQVASDVSAMVQNAISSIGHRRVVVTIKLKINE